MGRGNYLLFAFFRDFGVRTSHTVGSFGIMGTFRDILSIGRGGGGYALF